MNEEQKNAIVTFFEGVVINGISREVVFCERSEEGYIEVELRAPERVHMESVYLSIPIQAK